MSVYILDYSINIFLQTMSFMFSILTTPPSIFKLFNYCGFYVPWKQ